MPIYEYYCHTCEEITSTLVRSFSPPAAVKCEHCGSEDTEKVLSAPAVHMGPLNENKGKPSAEAQQASQDAAMREVADQQVKRMMKRMR